VSKCHWILLPSFYCFDRTENEYYQEENNKIKGENQVGYIYKQIKKEQGKAEQQKV
jgi:hypothetical protein